MAASLSSVPPVWPRPRPEIIGTKPAQAATIGPSNSEVRTPTPPVEWLSINALRQRQRNAFVHAHVVEIHRHRERGDLLVRDAAVDHTPYEFADLITAQRLPVAFLANDFLRQRHNDQLQKR